MSDHDSNLDQGSAPTITAADAVVAAFRQQCRHGRRPPIEQFLPVATDPRSNSVLLALIKADMCERSQAGEPIRVEDYVARFPTVCANESWLRDLLLEEFSLRRRYGDRPELAEFAKRFPEQVAALRAELGEDPPPSSLSHGPPSYPSEPNACDRAPKMQIQPAVNAGDERQLHLAPGSTIGEFTIVRLLGEGGTAQVYLARQQPLDRLVALKISAHAGTEARTLASLEHDHIVQVFAEHVVGSRRLMAMRYVPSITLARLLELLATTDRRRLTGADLLQLVDREVGETPTVENDAKRRDFAKLGFIRASVAIVAGLARALESAHRRQVLHRDIKPANILVSQSGRALLMDFNIAARGHAAPTPSAGGRSRAVIIADPPRQSLGGTPSYMAPEHLAAMALHDNAPAVDERSDIFSLGVVLYELLTGRHPFRSIDADTSLVAALNQMLAARLQGSAPVRSAEIRVSMGLESIVGKCLAADPARRYQWAGDLAEDLERFFDDRPLRYTPDPDWRERASKWLRRHHKFRVAAVAALGVTFFMALATAWSESSRLNEADRSIAQAQRNLAEGDAPGAAKLVARAAQGLAARTTVLALLGGENRRAEARVRLREAAQRVADDEFARFGRLVDSARTGSPSNSVSNTSAPPLASVRDPLQVYQVLDRADWQLSPTYQTLDAHDRLQVDEHVTELLVMMALDVLHHAPPGQSASDTRVALQRFLERVPTQHRSCQVVQQLMEWGQSGEPARSTPPSPPADWDEFDLYLSGVREAKEGRDGSARRYFQAAASAAANTDRAIRFWAHFQQADCSFRLGDLEEAIREYSACITLRPDFAGSYHNLGLVYYRQGLAVEAAEQFESALRRDPACGPAYSNLAAVQCSERRFAEAESTCDKAVAIGYEAAELYCNRGTARAEQKNFSGAIDDFRHALRLDPNCKPARENLDRLGVHR